MVKRTIEQNRMYDNASRMQRATAAQKMANYANSNYAREIKPRLDAAPEKDTSQSFVETIAAVITAVAIVYISVAIITGAAVLFGKPVYDFFSNLF